jgi:ribonuclease P protein component
VTVTFLAEVSAAPPRVAFAIPKAVGPAVTRNRLRRQCRAVLAAEPAMRSGAYLVRIGPEAAACDGATLRSDLSRALSAAHLRADEAGT